MPCGEIVKTESTLVIYAYMHGHAEVWPAEVWVLTQDTTLGLLGFQTEKLNSSAGLDIDSCTGMHDHAHDSKLLENWQALCRAWRRFLYRAVRTHA